jgi:GrpB-like predicted nucleotidyltransferase (UPF0157 family)
VVGVSNLNQLNQKHIDKLGLIGYLFRDYLRKHSKIKDEYYQLKRKLAEKYTNDRVSYTEGKSIFIQSVIDRAKKDIG